MDQAMPVRGCAGCLNRPPVRSFAQLAQQQPRAADDLRVLEGDIEALGLIGTQFDSAFVTTINSDALISARGGYAPLQLSGSRWRQSQKRIAMRMRPSGAEVIAVTPACPVREHPDSIHVTNELGLVQHRVELTRSTDALLTEGIPPRPQAPLRPARRRGPLGNVVSLPAIRAARSLWDAGSMAGHMDDILTSGGAQRRACLPYIGRAKARAVLPDVIGHFMMHLAQQQISFTRSVPGGTLMQSDTGALDGLHPDGDLLIARRGAGLMVIDQSSLSDIWVTRFRDGADDTHLIELYAHDGTCIAVLSRDYWTPADNWNALVASLPSA